METQKVLQLDPKHVLAENNVRFGLKKFRLERLKDDIMLAGRVEQPVKVVKLEAPQNGFTHRLVTGFYRHEAVSEINATNPAAGLTLPAIEEEATDAISTLRTQIRENQERENMSPIDEAIAIRKLLEAGASKQDVRNIFARVGGRKGLVIQEASNSHINMVLSFLDLPKLIQEKIHDGRVGTAAAYKLTKVPAEKRAEILEAAEAERIKALDLEEAEENKLLTASKKEKAAAEKVDKTVKELEIAKAEFEAADKRSKEAIELAAAAFKAKDIAPDAKTATEAKAAQKKLDEAFKAKEVEKKAAIRTADEAKVKLAKLESKAEQAEKLAKERKAKLAAARAGKVTGAAQKGKAVGPGDVERAAKAAGITTTGHTKLNASQIRDMVLEMSLPGGTPKLKAIGEALKMCIDGVTTPKQLFVAIKKVIGEK